MYSFYFLFHIDKFTSSFCVQWLSVDIVNKKALLWSMYIRVVNTSTSKKRQLFININFRPIPNTNTTPWPRFYFLSCNHFVFLDLHAIQSNSSFITFKALFAMFIRYVLFNKIITTNDMQNWFKKIYLIYLCSPLSREAN